MRDIPFAVPFNDGFITGIPLLDEHFDEDEDFIVSCEAPSQDDASVALSLKVRGYV